MVFSNPLSFSFAIPDISGKHKDKTIITNSHYTILNICLISDILQKNHHYLAEMLGYSLNFLTISTLINTILK